MWGQLFFPTAAAHVTDGLCADLFSEFAPTNCSAAPVKHCSAQTETL